MTDAPPTPWSWLDAALAGHGTFVDQLDPDTGEYDALGVTDAVDSWVTALDTVFEGTLDDGAGLFTEVTTSTGPGSEDPFGWDDAPGGEPPTDHDDGPVSWADVVERALDGLDLEAGVDESEVADPEPDLASHDTFEPPAVDPVDPADAVWGAVDDGVALDDLGAPDGDLDGELDLDDDDHDDDFDDDDGDLLD